jgi:hypothetical protein
MGIDTREVCRWSLAIGIVLAIGCKPGVPDFKTGDVYTLKAGDAYPGQYLALKIVEVSDGRTWCCLYRTRFDHRPTVEEMSGLTDRIPGLLTPDLVAAMDLQRAGFLEPTPEEISFLSASKETILRGHERMKR